MKKSLVELVEKIGILPQGIHEGTPRWTHEVIFLGAIRIRILEEITEINFWSYPGSNS